MAKNESRTETAPAQEPAAAQSEATKPASPPQHVHGKTKCNYCSAVARVTGTKREPASPGKDDKARVLVIRTMRCTGKHAHIYPLKTLEAV